MHTKGHTNTLTHRTQKQLQKYIHTHTYTRTRTHTRPFSARGDHRPIPIHTGTTHRNRDTRTSSRRKATVLCSNTLSLRGARRSASPLTCSAAAEATYTHTSAHKNSTHTSSTHTYAWRQTQNTHTQTHTQSQQHNERTLTNTCIQEDGPMIRSGVARRLAS